MLRFMRATAWTGKVSLASSTVHFPRVIMTTERLENLESASQLQSQRSRKRDRLIYPEGWVHLGEARA